MTSASLDVSGLPALAWMDRALCAEVGGDAWYPEKGEPTAPAKRVCMACPVRAECLEYALSHSGGDDDAGRWGTWGGLSEHERLKMRRGAGHGLAA